MKGIAEKRVNTADAYARVNFSTLQLNGFLNLGPCNRSLLS